MELELNDRTNKIQLKKVEKHIESLKTELATLEKKRNALRVLLDMPSVDSAEATEANSNNNISVRKKRKRRGLHNDIEKLFEVDPAPKKIKDIIQLLTEKGIEMKTDRPEVSVYSALKRHPELFMQKADNNWSSVEKT